jgi:hypothetical protein
MSKLICEGIDIFYPLGRNIYQQDRDNYHSCLLQGSVDFILDLDTFSKIYLIHFFTRAWL